MEEAHLKETNFRGANKINSGNNSVNLSISLYFSEFCQSTSIHGFRFLGERNRYIVEKLWWFLVVTVAGCSSAQLIYQAHEKWLRSPVVVTFARTETPIWDIPFPAVTVCPEVKSDPRVFNYTDVFLKYVNGWETTEAEDGYYDLFSLVCDRHPKHVSRNGTETITFEAFDELVESLLNLDIDSCRWLDDEYNCTQAMSYSYTSEGLCRTFNMVKESELYVGITDYDPNKTNTKQWSFEDGYSSPTEFNTSPRRTMLSGLKSGFQLDLFVDQDSLDHLCRDLQGFKVILHNPAEEPDMEKHFRLPLDQAIIVGIKPRMITTAKELRSYTPEARQCYLSNEKALGNFKIYTQQSCMFECLANYTLQACGCIAFYMPFVPGREFCGSGKRACMEEAKVHFLEREVTLKLKKTEGRTKEQCGCLPACTSIQFDSETSQTDWDWRKTIILSNSNRKNNIDKSHYSRLMVYYKDMQFMTSERQELYGTVDFLANCGGLLGLCCGFSFTSVMEILYFLTLRLVCNLKKFGRMV